MASKNITSQAFDHELLNEVIFDLTLNVVSKKFKSIKTKKVNEEKLKKSIWLASILSGSVDREHKRKAQLFTSLLFLNQPENIEIVKICYILYSRIGNLTATKFLKLLYQDEEDNPVNLKAKYEFDNLLTNELLYERGKKIIEVQERPYLITDFQKELWQALKTEKNISISAPTSSGKSFIIKKFIIDELANHNKYRAVYVVPSRALINQVSEEFLREFSHEVQLKTTFVEEQEISNKEIYVLTPERCIKILSSDLKVDFIFIDEIQGIEDTSGRGQIFEYVFNEMSVKYPYAKIVTAGPNILNPDKTFFQIFDRANIPIYTTLSPVFQIKLTLKKIEGSQFEIKIQSDENRNQIFKHTFDFDFSRLNTLGDQVAHIVNEIASLDTNIVYVKDGDLAQKWSRKLAEIKDDEAKLDDEVYELINFLKEDIHKRYYLIDCLKKGIAYHHSSLPDIVRKEIEVLFTNEKIKTLYCTSTLLEGVNLPANNLFTFQPKKDNTPLSRFEFGNLIGRAGRLNSSLYGTIFYLEKEADKIKPAEYLDNANYQKEIEIFSSSAFLDFELNDLKGSIKDINKVDKTSTNKARQFCVFIRLKYLKDQKLVQKYFEDKGLIQNEIDMILAVLKNSLSKINIPYKILQKNPSIDPVLQNELYEMIKLSEIEDWVISKNSLYNDYRTAQEVIKIPNQQRPFYWQLVNLIERLDAIFDLRGEAFVKHNKWVTPASLCVQAKKWLSTLPIGQIIQENINYQCSEKVDERYRKNSDNLEDLNSIINETIKYNSSITTFLLPKYIKILVDILEDILTEEQKKEYKVTLSLPTYLELGTQEPTVIQLISNGVTRSVAIQLYKVYRRTTSKDYRDHNDIWTWLAGKSEIPELKAIYNRYLQRIKVLG